MAVVRLVSDYPFAGLRAADAAPKVPHERVKLDLGRFLLHRRLERGLSRPAMSALLGIGEITLRNLEAGRRNTSLWTLQKIADSFEVPVWKLLKAATYDKEAV